MQLQSVSLESRILWPLVAVRVASLLLLLLTALTPSWPAAAAAAVLLLSYRWSATICTSSSTSSTSSSSSSNPLKGQPASKTVADLPDHLATDIGRSLLNRLADEASSSTLEAFSQIQLGSRCLFARDAKLLAGGRWQPSLGVAANAAASAWRLEAACRVLPQLQLDGFVLQLPPPHCDGFRRFARAVFATLRALAACDPQEADCMSSDRKLDSPGWVFTFAGVTFFVTTFAPFYPRSHSRFAYGADCGFVLLQPELSFARRDLPADTPHTVWSSSAAQQSQTVRDKIRCAFASAGQFYRTNKSPSSHPMIAEVVLSPRTVSAEDREGGEEEEEECQFWWQVAQDEEKQLGASLLQL